MTISISWVEESEWNILNVACYFLFLLTTKTVFSNLHWWFGLLGFGLALSCKNVWSTLAVEELDAFVCGSRINRMLCIFMKFDVQTVEDVSLTIVCSKIFVKKLCRARMTGADAYV